MTVSFPFFSSFLHSLDNKKLLTTEDVAGDIEMAAAGQQIAMNAICSLIDRNQKDIRSLAAIVKQLPHEPKREHSQTDIIKCITDNELEKHDADGNRLNRVKVTFKQPYKMAPTVLASVQRLEIPKTSDHRFEVRVEDVTPKDFTLVCLARGNETVIDLASVSYLSVPKLD